MLLVGLVKTELSRTIAGLLIAALMVVGSPLHVLADELGDAGEGGAQGSDGAQAGEVVENSAQDGGDGIDGTEGGEEVDESNDTENTDDGTEGDNQDDGTDHESDPSGEPSGDATIETGDSTVLGDVDTNANTNTTNTAIGTTGTTTGTSTDSGVPPSTHETEVVNNNTGTSTLEASADSETGENTASAPNGGVSIESGDALSWFSFSNVLNFNALNSEGIMLFLDYLFGDANTDFRDLFSFFSSPEKNDGCTGTCDGANSTLDATNNNNGTIQYDISSSAGTGQNNGYAGNGDGYIGTGNAVAGVTGTNVANVNFTDSQYLLLTLNNLGDLNRDIVFPGFEFFLNMFRGISPGSSVAATNNNNVQANTNIEGDADTGNNSVASEGGDACAATGKATSIAAVHNEFNQNIFGGNHINILIQVHGDFDGEVFGLPEGLVWNETEAGIQIMSDPSYAAASAGNATAFAGAKNTNVENNNELLIDGNINVTALTGDNKLEVTNGDGCIETGDATTIAAVNNFGNINVIGANWITAIFNIFGNFKGNISFGQPDLWIGGRAESLAGGFTPGSAVRYTFTVTNFGDSPASEVSLQHLFDESLITFNDDSDTAPGMRFSLGNLKPNESVELSFDAIIADALPDSKVPIISRATVSERETDANQEDNSEELTVVAGYPSGGGGGSEFRGQDAKLLLTKEITGADEIHPGEKAGYKIFVENRGGPAYHSVLVDTIYNEVGDIVYTQHWELETINSQEEITIEYDVIFATTTPPGTYRNEAYILAVENHPSLTKKIGKDVKSETASAEITVLGEKLSDIVNELVVESPECSKFLDAYIKLGQSNDELEVMKLQHFLSVFEGHDLAISGEYDQATLQAVHDFQKKYASDVLTPWGIDSSTGFVYYTTQKKINDLYCRGEKSFDLTPEQMREIENFKAKLEEIEAIGLDGVLPEDMPDLNEVGSAGGPRFAAAGDDDEYLDAPAREGAREPRRIAPVRNTAAIGEILEFTESTSEKVFDAVRSSIESVKGWVTQNFERARTLSDRR